MKKENIWFIVAFFFVVTISGGVLLFMLINLLDALH